jgi:antitoxin ParD1/3/4
MSDSASITMNVSLPERLKRYVDGKVASGFYGSASEFVREAIREKLMREQERDRAEAALAALLIEGFDSGPPIDAGETYAADKKRALRERVAKARASS